MIVRQEHRTWTEPKAKSWLNHLLATSPRETSQVVWAQVSQGKKHVLRVHMRSKPTLSLVVPSCWKPSIGRILAQAFSRSPSS